MLHQDIKHLNETKNQCISDHAATVFHFLIKALEALSITITLYFHENIFKC
jgi:hypothetical protein